MLKGYERDGVTSNGSRSSVPSLWFLRLFRVARDRRQCSKIVRRDFRGPVRIRVRELPSAAPWESAWADRAWSLGDTSLAFRTGGRDAVCPPMWRPTLDKFSRRRVRFVTL